jgi:orotidine-5'-phosphate decarboxylase
MLIVTPGVKLQGESATETPTEHARPAHPAAAIRAGATHIIVGRSLTRAPDPAAEFAHLLDELCKLRVPNLPAADSKAAQRQ